MSAAAMSVAAPTPGAPEKEAVRSMFDRIAPRYDLLNRLLSAGVDRRWRRRCVDRLALPAAGHVLDLCTGTADLLIEALGRAPAIRGVGVDLATRMLALGRRKLRDRGQDARAALAAADVERLPFRSARFDGVMVAFGIRNVPDAGAALGEAGRVLRPGGTLVVLEFSTPGGILGRVYRAYFHRLLPRVGGWISGDPSAYAYLPASVDRFPTPDAFRALMERAGFAAVTAERLTGGIAYLYRGVKA